MKTSTIVNAANLNNKFNTALTEVVNNSVEANKAINIMSEVMECFGPFEYLIAGGAYRDPLMGSEVVDVDIFLIGMDRDTFRFICHTASQITGHEKHYDHQDSYGEGTTSLRVDKINFVHKQELIKPQEVIEQFSASCSKVGKWVDGYNNSETIFYCEEGMKDFLLHKTVEFYYDTECYLGLRKYINKISHKQWAKGMTFKCQMPYFLDEVVIKESLDLLKEDISHAAGIALAEGGIFISDQELSLRSAQISQYIWSLDTNNVLFSTKYYSKWVDILNKGLLDIPFTDSLIMLSEAELLTDYSYKNTRLPSKDLIESSVGIWNRSQLGIYEKKNEYLGWDCLYLNTTLRHQEVKKLLDAGKTRMALQASNSIEVFLSSKGLSNKVKGRPHDPNYLGFGCGFLVSTSYMRNLLGGLKIKGKLIQPCNTYEDLASACAWSTILGSEYIHLSGFYRSHDMMARGYDGGPIPTKYHSQIAKSETLCCWVFEHRLKVVWNKKTAKACVMDCLEQMYPQLNIEEIYHNPSLRSVMDFIEKYPSKGVTHNFPEVSLKRGGVTMELLPKEDPKNLYIGDLTACCQRLGSVGEAVCIEGWNDQYSINYVFKSATSNKVIAHAWVWEDVEGNFVIDSLEGRAHADISDIAGLVSGFAQIVKEEYGVKTLISRTSYGMTQDVVHSLKLSEEEVCLESKTKYTYMDANVGEGIYIVD